jgi:hypothetical protein
MSNAIKIRIGLHAVLLTSTIVFALLFRTSYAHFIEQGLRVTERDPVEHLQTYDKPRAASPSYSGMMAFAALFLVSAIGFGLLVGHDVSHMVIQHSCKLLFDDEGELLKTPEHELAEEEWANGNPLEAIQMMRNYLREHPREQHVALRIAEIYEKDLKNYLAAALEYEEVLKQKLPAEQWGWTAIHLCNLYRSRLNQPQKAVALLQRIDTEYGHTAAAEKARKHLGVQEAEGEAPPPPAPKVMHFPKRTGPASDEVIGEDDD